MSLVQPARREAPGEGEKARKEPRELNTKHVGRNVSSVELVPGDLIDIANIHTVPCDAMLVSGDCILNESMLTGESVPVSKMPINDATLKKMNLSSSSIPAEIAKHFLFMGTKMVRVRGGDNVTTATAIVVRTGFSTAKGALVRSMLFPKPNNFKFYRDSFRFIGVLSVIGKLIDLPPPITHQTFI